MNIDLYIYIYSVHIYIYIYVYLYLYVDRECVQRSRSEDAQESVAELDFQVGQSTWARLTTGRDVFSPVTCSAEQEHEAGAA